MRNIINFSLSGVTALMLFTHSSQDTVYFQTYHRFGAGTKRGYPEQLIIPFDRYTLHAFSAAIDPATNDSVYIAQFEVASSLGSFVILSRDVDASERPYLSDNGRVTPHTGSRVLNAEIKRSTIAQTFILSLALVNWLLTIGTVYVTTLVASGKMEANDVIAALPISMMLAIPEIRDLYTESPGLCTSLGTFHVPLPTHSCPDSLPPDTAGFFVQLLAIALCELILLRILTRHRSPPSQGGSA